MAGSTGVPVGPFPEGADPEEHDKLRRRVLWTMPYGLYVLGCRSADRERLHAMTINWVTQVSFEPKLVAVGVEKTALTHTLITDAGVFSLCVIDREDRSIVRKFVKPAVVDKEARTINDVPYIERATGAPILAQCVAWLDCELRQAVDAGGHTLFIGEPVECGFEKDEATPVLRMEDTRMNYGG